MPVATSFDMTTPVILASNRQPVWRW